MSSAEKIYVTPEMVEWLANGERGISSDTMFTNLTGINAMRRSSQSHPYDPADLRRCRLLLERCPILLLRLHMMRDVSKEWAGLIDQWEVICSSMDDESPKWRDARGSAPKTYELMRKATGRDK